MWENSVRSFVLGIYCSVRVLILICRVSWGSAVCCRPRARGWGLGGSVVGRWCYHRPGGGLPHHHLYRRDVCLHSVQEEEKEREEHVSDKILFFANV